MTDFDPTLPKFSFTGKPHRSSSRKVEKVLESSSSVFSIMNVIPIIICIGTLGIVFVMFRELQKNKLQNIAMSQYLKSCENKLMIYGDKVKELENQSNIIQPLTLNGDYDIVENDSSDSDIMPVEDMPVEVMPVENEMPEEEEVVEIKSKKKKKK